MWLSVYLRQARHSLAVTEVLGGACRLASFLNERCLEEALGSPALSLTRAEKYLGFLETTEAALELAAGAAAGPVKFRFRSRFLARIRRTFCSLPDGAMGGHCLHTAHEVKQLFTFTVNLNLI